MVNSAAFEKNILEHKSARKIFDPDVIKIMNDTLMMMPVDLSFIKKAADLRKIKAFSMDSNFVKKSVEGCVSVSQDEISCAQQYFYGA